MGLYCIVVTRSIEMSQKVINLSLQLFVFLAIFLVDVGSSGSFNITRHTTGDVFDNTNSSKSCNESGASCVFDGENSPFCGVNCCSCICPSKMPTYLLRSGSCTSEDHLLSILKAESAKQGCKYRMVVTESHNQCSRPVLTTLSTLNPGNKTLYLCPWKGFSLLHFTNVKDMVKCEIVPQESLHLNGSWQHLPQDDPALSRLKVKIGQDPDFDNNRLSLEWLADIGKEYDGLIFSLKLKCQRKGEEELHSCVHFKKAGSFTNAKPTFRPPAPIKINPSRTTTVTQEKQETTTTGLPQTEEIALSTTHTSTFVLRNGEVVSSSSSQSKVNLVVVILSALSGVLFATLALLAVFFLLSRRRRRFQMRKGVETVNNPVYARGSSDTLKMATVAKENGQNTEKSLDYQPLVENTKPTERKYSLPDYLIVFRDRRPNQQQTSNGDIRSSNYLSLLKGDPEDLREYQTLMKVVNPVLEIANEDKIPDYAEIEERTDSEDASDSSDSQDYKEPPGVPPRGGKRRIAPRRQKLNDLCSEVNDYDEPEGIIVISDNEAETHEKARKVINDFHDYTDETNASCHVKRPEDLPCYHDYDDPE
ncbi:uncharacterized protein LOC114962203 isoform X2 [Acropora millepora]|uniref:uncharacterized protein LOC114962203 isoform X2 n=1 Tax=Acropora millepora TaxID=45264 RepID=UPI0010FC750D|nr:uncharacterized protein LOC114962203 isoform X2 [Acropora millepora]